MKKKRYKKNIVLLTTDSRESRSKEKNYRGAADSLGLGVKRYPDRDTIGVFPCSDSRAVDAAWLAQRHRVKGPDPLAVETIINKSLAFQFLRRQGFNLLFWHMPQDESDFEGTFKRPIIVKPEKGSGSIGLHPWAYRIYRSPAHFKRWLKKEKLLNAFLQHQNFPFPSCGRYMMMEYVDSTLYTVSAAISDAAVAAYEYCEMLSMPTRMQLGWAMIGRRHKDSGSILKMIQALARFGYRRAVVYFQCVERGGKLYPIDINLRPGTMTHYVVNGMRLPLHERLLGFMLGMERYFNFKWPAPYIGIRRIEGPLRSGRYKATFRGDAVSLLEELRYDKKKSYDVGHAWPVFAVLAETPTECYRKEKAIAARVKIRKQT